jgi:hypothetical protein
MCVKVIDDLNNLQKKAKFLLNVFLQLDQDEFYIFFKTSINESITSANFWCPGTKQKLYAKIIIDLFTKIGLKSVNHLARKYETFSEINESWVQTLCKKTNHYLLN